MNRKVWTYLELAGKTASKRDDKRYYWLGAVAIRSDGAVVTACNGSATERTREIHAEYRVSKRIDHGATVYVARVRRCDNEFANAKPCVSCQNAMKARNVKKVYYTTSKDEYGVMDFT